MIPRCLPLPTAAAYVGCKPAALRDYGPEPIRIGKRLYWVKEQLDAWIDGMSKLPIKAGNDDEAEALRRLGL